jgi:hypothetical protein
MVLLLLAAVCDAVKEIQRRCIRASIAQVYSSEGAACIDAGMKQSHFSEMMAGLRSLNLDSLSNLDKRVWSWYSVFLVQEFDIPEELNVAQRLDAGAKRMARMDSPEMARRIA